jgi:GNAT superfamily N-acetyltransferase
MNPTTNHIVRLATADDASALARLRFAFRAEQHPVIESEPEFTARCVAWVRPRIGPGSRWRIWVLENISHSPRSGESAVEREILGMLWVQIVEKIPNPGREPELHAYVSSFFVRAEARNAGGGSRLLQAALDECRAFHVDSMFLWPTARSRPLYERHGFQVSDAILVNQL